MPKCNPKPAEPREQRACVICRRDITQRRKHVLYCSPRCCRRGTIRPGSWELGSWKLRRRKLGFSVDGEFVAAGDLLQRDGLDCQICGEPLDLDDMQMDHVIPVGDPRSTHTADNLRMTHRSCNYQRGNKRDTFTL